MISLMVWFKYSPNERRTPPSRTVVISRRWRCERVGLPFIGAVAGVGMNPTIRFDHALRDFGKIDLDNTRPIRSVTDTQPTCMRQLTHRIVPRITM